jgi:CheY-like chemotaxis protein
VRAAELTRQLLAFARGGQYTLEPIDMNQVVADTTSLLSKSLDPRIAIEMKRDAGLPAVEADAGQMTQIVLNVAVNAAEAMPEGGRITFETRLSRLDEAYARANPGVRSGEYVEVVIADTGAGMTSEIADRAFEPFFTTKPAGKGTGLGLSVVYGIVKNHRGHVQLTSTKGLGTTVRLYLPVGTHHAAQAPPSDPARRSSAAADMPPARTTPVEAPPSATAPPSPASAAQPATGRPAPIPETPGPAAGPRPNAASPAPPAAVVPGSAGRILVVDDEDAIRQLARDILESRGFDVVLANDGVDALEKYRAHWGTIDLVLLDMVMPKMGGLETFRRLLGIDRAIRVVLCSGFAENEHSQQAIREGALGLLSKPFTMAELMARVQKCLRRDGARPAR